MLPGLVSIMALAVAGIVYRWSERASLDQPWFPWLLVPLALTPQVLAALGLGFAAMVSMYISIPATMGPLTFAYSYLFANFLGMSSVLLWLLAVAFALAWLGLVRWLWQRQRLVAYVVWLFGLIVPGLLLYTAILPPT